MIRIFLTVVALGFGSSLIAGCHADANVQPNSAAQVTLAH